MNPFRKNKIRKQLKRKLNNHSNIELINRLPKILLPMIKKVFPIITQSPIVYK